jgi:hypothetical protein
VKEKERMNEKNMLYLSPFWLPGLYSAGIDGKKKK